MRHAVLGFLPGLVALSVLGGCALPSTPLLSLKDSDLPEGTAGAAAQPVLATPRPAAPGTRAQAVSLALLSNAAVGWTEPSGVLGVAMAGRIYTAGEEGQRCRDVLVSIYARGEPSAAERVTYCLARTGKWVRPGAL